MYPESARNFESNKILGGVGAILTAVGSFVPFAGSIGIVAIVGIILMLISIRGLSEDYREPAIWRNTLNGFVFGIVAIAIAIGVFAALFFSIFSIIRNASFSGFFLGVVGAIIGLVIVFIFFVLEAIFFKHAFDLLGQKSGVKMFHTGALLLLIGAVLTIVLIGFLLLFVAWVLIGVAFFSMQPPTQTNPTTPEPTSQSTNPIPASGQIKYCQYCGAENRLDGTFCTRCGRRLA